MVKIYRARACGRFELGEQETEKRVELKLSYDTATKKAFVDEAKGRLTVTLVRCIEYDLASDTTLIRVQLLTGARHQIRGTMAHLGHPIKYDTAYGGGEGPIDDSWRLYKDNDQGQLAEMLRETTLPWCNKCKWTMESALNGGMERGADRAHHFIMLLSYQYVIPSLDINAVVPNHLLPEWAREV